MKTAAREKILQEELERIVKILTQKYRAQKIILFGSLAEGQPGNWSDLDILVIKKTHRRLIDRIGEVISLCKPKIATDFIVYNPEEFRELCQTEPFVQKEIVEKGKILYERE